MEFHGTSSAPISLTQAVPWNSMEFHGTWNALIPMTRAVPLNSMELGMRHFRWHEQFHGIPWNLGCANFADTSSSMEFHGTWSAPISLTRAVSWNSMDFHGIAEFHGTRSAPISLTWAVPWNCMDLGVRQFLWHEKFHGIPWNFKCANFVDTSSSMEFHGIWSVPISLTRAVPWNSMEFHGTWNAPISMTRAVPWISVELWMRHIRWHEQFHGIPWNSMELGVRQIRWHEQFHGIPWNLECANFANTSSSMEFHGTRSAPISLTRAGPISLTRARRVRRNWRRTCFLHITAEIRVGPWHDVLGMNRRGLHPPFIPYGPSCWWHILNSMGFPFGQYGRRRGPHLPTSWVQVKNPRYQPSKIKSLPPSEINQSLPPI